MLAESRSFGDSETHTTLRQRAEVLRGHTSREDGGSNIETLHFELTIGFDLLLDILNRGRVRNGELDFDETRGVKGSTCLDTKKRVKVGSG